MKHRLYLDGAPQDVWLAASGDSHALHWNGGIYALAREEEAVVIVDRDTVHIHLDGRSHVIRYEDALSLLASGASEDGAAIRAPMPGVVLAVRVEAGDVVTAGQPLLTIESMKLETVIRAPRGGVVEALNFAAGQAFARDALLVSLAAGEN
jgi:biotin carboxyl carrier protein